MRMTSCNRGHCLGCCCNMCIVLVLIPCLIFALSAIFASILWFIECSEAMADEAASNATSSRLLRGGGGGFNPFDNSELSVCSWYEWFLYVCGNLAGLGNPLTNVGPQSGHFVAEMVDLVVCMWALAIIGTVVGLIGGLAAMGAVTDLMNAAVKQLSSVSGALHTVEMTSAGKSRQPKDLDATPTDETLNALGTLTDHVQALSHQMSEVLARLDAMDAKMEERASRRVKVVRRGGAEP